MLDREGKESTKLEIIMSWSIASKLSKKMRSTRVLHLLIKCEDQYEGIFRYAKVSKHAASLFLSFSLPNHGIKQERIIVGYRKKRT